MSDCPQRILVIDDEDIVQLLLRDVLESLGYEILQAADGKAGLELYREHTCDLIITDIRMPVMDGFGVIEAIREEGRDTPILALAGDDDGVLEKALECGANSILRKPFRIEDLTGKVTELVADR